MVLHNPSVCEIFADIRGWLKFENKYGYVASSYKCQLRRVNTYVLALLVQTEEEHFISTEVALVTIYSYYMPECEIFLIGK